jgi:DnaK suppressor protein
VGREQDYSKLKEALESQRTKLIQGLNHIQRENLNTSQRDASGDLSGYSLHMADMATDNFDREFSLDLATNEQKLLNHIDEALAKFQDGSYGSCENCNKVISMKRLKAVPYAHLCIKCQDTAEKNSR